VVGAAVTVTDPETNQTFTTVTDNQGKYNVAGLPPGTYVLTVSAAGFNETRRNEVKVDEGAAATVDMKLEMRQMMKDSNQVGDKRFIAMMQDFIKSHYNKDVSTEDLKRIVEKHMTKEMDLAGNKRMDWFFDQWVYGTEMPSYQFDYQIGSDGALTGKITQSGVSPKFMMPIPVYVDYGKGWVRLGVAGIAGNSTVDLGKVPLGKGAKRAAICAMNDVLALKIQNNK